VTLPLDLQGKLPNLTDGVLNQHQAEETKRGKGGEHDVIKSKTKLVE
jgi:hypothetical protein